MDCKQTREFINFWVDGELSPEESASVGQHLARCNACREEFKAYTRAWNALKVWPDVEPAPGYVSRFWTRLREDQAWYERFWNNCKPFLADKFFVPAFAAVLIFITAAGVIFYNTFSATRTETVISSLSADEIDLVEHLEIVENFEVLKDLEFLQDLDVIESLADDRV